MIAEVCMVEQLMFLGLGFLSASLMALLIIPAVHARAVRLTERRLRDVTTLATAEIQAKKDLLRAEFAMAVCRAERRAEMLETKMTSLLAELGRRSDVINRVRIELGQGNGETTGDTRSVTLVPEHEQIVPGLQRGAPAKRTLSAPGDIAEGGSGPGGNDRDQPAPAIGHRHQIETRHARAERLEALAAEDALQQILAIARG